MSASDVARKLEGRGDSSEVMVKFVHGVSPSDKDVAGPYPASESDFRDLPSARKWFKKHLRSASLGRGSSFRREGERFIFFPRPMFGGVWWSISITPVGGWR